MTEDDLARTLAQAPRTLLVLRTILGLSKDEFAHSTVLAGAPTGLPPLSTSKVDSMESEVRRPARNRRALRR